MKQLAERRIHAAEYKAPSAPPPPEAEGGVPVAVPLASPNKGVFSYLLNYRHNRMSEQKFYRSGTYQGARGLIFVVDDEVMLLELASIILEPRGYAVRTFCDPKAALEAFSAADPRPQLLITDYAMHHMNGMALIAACRKIEPRQKILLISGTVDAEIYSDSACKPDGFVAKPYHARELIEAVEAMMAG